MARNPTISDLAKAAGVGVATVDRALHGRPNVSARALAQIAQAAARIGFHAPALSNMRHRTAQPLRLGFVLHKGAQSFYRSFAEHLTAACAAQTGWQVTPEIRFSPSQSPDDFCGHLREAAKTCAAIATTAINHTSVAKLSGALISQGTPVFAVLNDFGRSVHSGYFGLDNMKAGRIAGSLMALRLQGGGRVAVFVGGNRWHGHALRETGFRSYLREDAGQLTVLDTLINLETRQFTYEATLDLLDRYPDLRGIYVAGGGMEGAITAVREIRPAGTVALIVNELTPESRAGLVDRYVDFVIATPLEQLSQHLVATMVNAASGAPVGLQTQKFFDPALWMPESV